MEPFLYPLARQANALVRSPLKLNHIEARIFALALACISSEDKELPQIRIPMKSIYPKSKSGIVWKQINEATTSLMSKVVHVTTKKVDGKRNTKKYGIISFMEIDEGTGYVTGNFAPEIKPFLLDLVEHYTQVEIKTLMTLKSAHAHRLYWALKSWDDVGSWEVEIDEFTAMMVGADKDGNVESAYSIFYDFKRYVLEPAIRELHELGWMITWEPDRQGRKVIGLKFLIPKFTPKDDEQAPIDITPKSERKQRKPAQLSLDIQQGPPTLQQRIIGRLQKLSVTPAQIKTIISFLGDDEALMTKFMQKTAPILTAYEAGGKTQENIGGKTINFLKTEFQGLFNKI